MDLAWRRIPDGMPRRDVAWQLLRELLPPGAELSNPCPRCGGPHGPVRVTGADAVASVSYAGDIAVVVVAAGVGVGAGVAGVGVGVGVAGVGVAGVDAGAGGIAAIGVDAEPAVDPRRDAAGLHGVLGEGEASVRSWTRVEAALKADGRGLRVDPATVVVRETSDGWTARVPGSGTFLGTDAAAPPELIVSVAVRPL